MTKSILFIDDSTMEYELFSEAAEICGYTGQSFCITDPRKVFTHLKNNENLPDLIMIDIRMPHINGHQLTRKLKMHPRYCDIYRVMFSTSDLITEREKAAKHGANYFFSKPEQFTEYPVMVAQMLAMAHENKQVA